MDTLVENTANKALVPIGVKRIEALRGSMEEACRRGLLDSFEAPLKHYVTGDIYGRRVYVPAGVTVVTKVHDTKHITVALKGTCTVYDHNGKKSIVSSPNVFITEPGTQRAIYCHDDVEWLTVHSTKLTEIEDIESAMFCDNFNEYDDRQDYREVLLEYGINEEIARAISENMDDMLNELGSECVYLAKSDLQGIGVFSDVEFQADQVVGIARKADLRTDIGRYTNHSKNPNTEFKICDNVVQSIALKSIAKGTEITVDYRQAFKIANKMRLMR